MNNYPNLLFELYHSLLLYEFQIGYNIIQLCKNWIRLGVPAPASPQEVEQGAPEGHDGHPAQGKLHGHVLQLDGGAAHIFLMTWDS